MSKVEIEHKDKFGRVLSVGDAVVYPSHNSLELGTVKKLNPKMVKVWEAGRPAGRWYTGVNKYPEDLVKVDGPEITMFLLRKNSSS